MPNRTTKHVQRRVKVDIPDALVLARVEALFHGLIRSRACEFGIDPPRRLPRIADVRVHEEEPEWFPVPGMYGGFAFRLTGRGEDLEIVAESWNRIVAGSGRRHRVSPDQVILVAQGFV